jgi:hypothetical protein
VDFGADDARIRSQKTKETEMFKRAWLLVVALIFIYWAAARAQQHPLLDEIANKVINKYQQSSCEQLWQKNTEPKTPKEKEAIELLRNKPEIRTEFLNRVAAPIANKMFECGLIP